MSIKTFASFNSKMIKKRLVHERGYLIVTIDPQEILLYILIFKLVLTQYFQMSWQWCRQLAL